MIQFSERIQNLKESPIVTFAALANKCDRVVRIPDQETLKPEVAARQERRN